jgi:hypothetical protein
MPLISYLPAPSLFTHLLPYLPLPPRVSSSFFQDNEEQQQAAGAALGDLVQKMGDAVLQKIVPILQQNLISGDAKTRQGVCQVFIP